MEREREREQGRAEQIRAEGGRLELQLRDSCSMRLDSARITFLSSGESTHPSDASLAECSFRLARHLICRARAHVLIEASPIVSAAHGKWSNLWDRRRITEILGRPLSQRAIANRVPPLLFLPPLRSVSLGYAPFRIEA